MKSFWLWGLAALVAPSSTASAQDTPSEIVEAVQSAREEDRLTEELSAKLGKRCLEIAANSESKDERYQSLYLVLQLQALTGHASLDGVADKAIDELTANFADDPARLTPIIVDYLKQDPRGVRARLVEKTGSDGVRVACGFAAIVGKLESGGAANEADKKKLMEELVQLGREYGDEPDPSRRNKPWSEAIQKLRMKMERNLYIGAIAPDIEGADLNGVDFKLSDYRGKVVVLDFWGNW